MRPFDNLHLEDSDITEVDIDRNAVRIWLTNVGVFPPDCNATTRDVRWLPKAQLLFNNVVSSQRTVHEYGPDGKTNGKKPAYTVQDGPFETSGGSAEKYELHCVQKHPPAWVDWTIQSESFKLVEET